MLEIIKMITITPSLDGKTRYKHRLVMSDRDKKILLIVLYFFILPTSVLVGYLASLLA